MFHTCTKMKISKNCMYKKYSLCKFSLLASSLNWTLFLAAAIIITEAIIPALPSLDSSSKEPA